MTTAVPQLPPAARREACLRLIGLGLYPQARDLLDPADALFGVQVSLLAGDVGAARTFLLEQLGAPPHITGGADRSGTEDLLNGCIALAGGNASALDATERLLAAQDATALDYAVFAVVAAPHDLHRAQVAAQPTLEILPAAVPVAAASAAADADYELALALLEREPWNGISEDPVQGTLTLLRMHGREDAAQALVAFGAQIRTLRPNAGGTGPVWGRKWSAALAGTP